MTFSRTCFLKLFLRSCPKGFLKPGFQTQDSCGFLQKTLPNSVDYCKRLVQQKKSQYRGRECNVKETSGREEKNLTCLQERKYRVILFCIIPIQLQLRKLGKCFLNSDSRSIALLCPLHRCLFSVKCGP